MAMEIRHPGPEEKEQLLALWKGSFGAFDGFWEKFLRGAFSEAHCLCVTRQGQLQGTLYWFDCRWHGTWAYIFAVATHPAHRGKGLCRELMAHTLAHLRVLGYQGALLVPADDGLRRMYGGMGYRSCAALCQERWAAGNRPAPLRQVPAEEYARLRPALLPEDGVRQEGGLLALLEATGTLFFAGNGCLLALEPGQTPRLLEYLGDRDGLPAVLNALGLPQAQVRFPGRQLPFAMGIPLREGAELPGYFAFALD